jgi:hypothetical protein
LKKPDSDAVRGGGHHSLEILKELASARIRATGSPRASRAVSDLNWQRAQSYAIQRDDFRTIWHAGHITALLTNGVDLIAGTQTGGVWLLHSVVGPNALAGYTGTPLSEAWDTPDISCLTWGTEGAEAFVGTRAQAVFLLEFETVLGGHLTLKQSTILPVPFTDTVAMVTLTNPRRIVVVTANNVWWSPIPQPATHASGYDWQQAQGLPMANYTGLAAGPAASVAVAAFGGPPTGVGTPPPGGAIHRGTFQGDALVFLASSIEGMNLSLMRTTSLASCDDQRERMYAVAAGTDNMILGVLVSRDGGVTWHARTSPNKAQAGFQGGYNNCIAVSPQRPDLLVIGWLSGGPFFSDDGSESWQHPLVQESSGHLHNDLHAVLLGRNPNGPEPLYVGGDGGVAVTLDTGLTYHSHFNRPLNNLQFYGGKKPTVRTNYGGTLTASSRYPGLLASGLQDNGNVYRCPDARRGLSMPRQADTPWLRQVGGDGELNRFVDRLGALLNFDNTNINLGLALWNEKTNRFPDGAGTVIPADDSASGVAPTAVDVVQKPTFRRNGQLMYGATGSTGEGFIHGLFADDPAGDVPEARNAKLIRLGFAGSVVTALASLDGLSLMAGTETGRIVSLDCASGAVTQFALPDQAEGIVSRIEIFPAPQVAGSLPNNAFALVGNGILYFNGLFWSTTTGSDWQTFAYDVATGRLFAATDGDVFVSHDRARTWIDASVGLPVRPHCSDLRIAADGTGGRDLYLATYGHSVWRATIAQRSQIVELPPEAVEILIGMIDDGGGVVRLGKRIIKIPPRPLIRDLLALLVVDDASQSMSEESNANSRAIRRAALQEIATIAMREVERLG